MEDPYLQALYNGEITPDQYRQLTEGQATPAAPAIAPKAPVNTTRDDLAAHLAAQDETIATLSVRDEDTKREARGMLERGEITPAQYRALTGLNAPTPTPTTTAAPAKRTSARNWEDSMPKTFEPDPNPRLSSKAKLRDVESRFNVYMTNLRAALNNGDISANDFMVRHDAAMKNYQAVRNMFGDMDTSFPPQEPYRPLGPTTADLYPNGYPEELGVLGRVGNSAFGQGVESFGNWLKSLV
jgi:hypothetical protein